MKLYPSKPRIVTVRVIQQRCPICEGRKHVPAGFYTGLVASLNPDRCEQCGGTGMIAATETVTQEDS